MAIPSSPYLTSYQKDYYWKDTDINEIPRNEYEKRLVWSRCPWRWYPTVGQTVFRRHYQPWGILPRWPHLFSIDETHEHARDQNEIERHPVIRALAASRTAPVGGYQEESVGRRIPYRSFLPPIYQDSNDILYHPRTQICDRTFTAPIWFREGRTNYLGKDLDRVVYVQRPRRPFEIPRWETTHKHDYTWDLTAD